MAMSVGCMINFLGPFLILVACSIIIALTSSFFNVFLPWLAPQGIWSIKGLLHTSIVIYLLINVVLNYTLCVITRNTHNGKKYDRVVRELAIATTFNYPETPQQLDQARRDYQSLIAIRRQSLQEQRQRQQQQSNGGTTAATTNVQGAAADQLSLRAWTLQGAHVSLVSSHRSFVRSGSPTASVNILHCLSLIHTSLFFSALLF